VLIKGKGEVRVICVVNILVYLCRKDSYDVKKVCFMHKYPFVIVEKEGKMMSLFVIQVSCPELVASLPLKVSLTQVRNSKGNTDIIFQNLQ